MMPVIRVFTSNAELHWETPGNGLAAGGLEGMKNRFVETEPEVVGGEQLRPYQHIDAGILGFNQSNLGVRGLNHRSRLECNNEAAD